ncbi:MAG TPA: EamA family transporter [Candidatus Baltobacteraceae bacterium]|nr:EamA family transporter [Candidatus Baltobacteraceae bacterium]
MSFDRALQPILAQRVFEGVNTARYLPWVALVAVWILWGSTYSAIRVAVETIPPYLMIGTRYVIAGLLLWGIHYAIASRKPSLPSLRDLARIAVTGILLLVLGNGLLAFSETRVPSGIAALLVASMPIWMLILEALRVRTMISIASIAGLIIGSAGVFLLVGELSGQANGFYAALILFSAFAWALGTIYARTTIHHPLTVPFEMIAGGVVAVAVGLFLGEARHFSLAQVSAQSWYGMLWLVTGGAMVGYTAYAFIVRTLPAPTVATYAYVNPIVAVVLGVLLLREPVTWNVVAGGLAIVASVAVILIGNRRLDSQLEGNAGEEVAA